MVSGESALLADHVSKRYSPTLTALEDVTMSVPARSITALIGPNGAGKSTLLKTWMGFERPSSGHVEVAGIDPWRHRREALAKVAYVPQEPALYRSFTVADHLDFADVTRKAFNRTAAADHLRRLDIPLSTNSMALSGGQQAQVMLALALGIATDVVLLDEPLARLDPLARTEFLSLVESNTRQRGLTTVLSSHILSDVEQVCDRMVILATGRVVLDDSIASVMSSHWTSEAASQLPDRFVAIGRLPERRGHAVFLLRSWGVPTIAQTSESGVQAATLDQIVNGYLLNARPGDPPRGGAR